MNPAPMIEFQKMVNGRLAVRFTVSEETATSVEHLLREKGYEQKRRGRARPVIVWGQIDHEVYRRRIEQHGAEPVFEGEKFPSGAAVARHFRYRYNEIKQAFCRARQQGEDIAIVAGVPLRYEDTIRGSD